MTDSIIDADPTIDRSPGADFKLFNAVFVDFPDLATDATQGDDVDASQLADLRAKLQKDLESVFFKRYARAAAAGPYVLVVHSKIVRAVPNKPFKNIAPLGRAVGAGRGYAAIEATLCNGANGAVLLRYTYTDAEMRAIWHRRWLFAVHAVELAEPGSFVTLEIGREPLLLVRGRDREVRAFANVCRHRGSRVCTAPHGRAARGEVFGPECAMHGASAGLSRRDQLQVLGDLEESVERTRRNFALQRAEHRDLVLGERVDSGHSRCGVA